MAKFLGTYYLKTNHNGPGQHVCNCGYMVSSAARGKGLARRMCEHSQIIAREMGYRAMQFNFVASSNEVAVSLWQKLGFQIVGRLPKAFDHPTQGFVDAFVMYRNGLMTDSMKWPHLHRAKCPHCLLTGLTASLRGSR